MDLYKVKPAVVGQTHTFFWSTSFDFVIFGGTQFIIYKKCDQSHIISFALDEFISIVIIGRLKDISEALSLPDKDGPDKYQKEDKRKIWPR